MPSPAELAATVARLQALGATVTWPAGRPPAMAAAGPADAGAIPAPMIGQVWSSPRPGIASRAVLEIGPHPSWARPRLWFAVPGDSSPVPRHVSPRSWRAWARRTDARPVECG